MHDLVQTGFFGAESSLGDEGEIIISSDWMAFPEEDFRQVATERHRELDQQEAVVDAFKNQIIREKGELYRAAKAKLKHGEFLNWLEEIKVSSTTVEDYMLIAKKLGSELSNSRRVGNLPFRQWIRIARSPENKRIIAKVEAGEIEATPSAINAELEAARKRAEEAEQKTQTTQQELFQTRTDSHNAIIQLTQQIETIQKQRDELQEKIFTLSAPEAVEIEKQVLPPEIVEQIEHMKAEAEKLQTELKKTTEHRDRLFNDNKELGNDIKTLREASKAQKAQEQHEARIKKNWRQSTETFYKQIVALITQFPSPVDTQIFETEDWNRLAQSEQLAQQFLDQCRNLHQMPTSMVVDAR